MIHCHDSFSSRNEESKRSRFTTSQRRLGRRSRWRRRKGKQLFRCNLFTCIILLNNCFYVIFLHNSTNRTSSLPPTLFLTWFYYHFLPPIFPSFRLPYPLPISTYRPFIRPSTVFYTWSYLSYPLPSRIYLLHSVYLTSYLFILLSSPYCVSYLILLTIPPYFYRFYLLPSVYLTSYLFLLIRTSYRLLPYFLPDSIIVMHSSHVTFFISNSTYRTSTYFTYCLIPLTKPTFLHLTVFYLLPPTGSTSHIPCLLPNSRTVPLTLFHWT